MQKEKVFFQFWLQRRQCSEDKCQAESRQEFQITGLMYWKDEQLCVFW